MAQGPIELLQRVPIFHGLEKLHWDTDLVADGTVLAAGTYSFLTDSFPSYKLWGIGFYSSDNPVALVGAMPLSDVRHKKHGHVLIAFPHFHESNMVMPL